MTYASSPTILSILTVLSQNHVDERMVGAPVIDYAPDRQVVSLAKVSLG